MDAAMTLRSWFAMDSEAAALASSSSPPPLLLSGISVWSTISDGCRRWVM